MKRVKQFSIWIIALIGLMIANHPAWAADTTPPKPGGYEAGYPKATGTTTIEVKWKRATDGQTAQADLRYKVGWKKKSGGSWQYSHPWPVTNWPKDWTSYTITGLEPNTEYEVDVEVVDQAGNFQWYGEKTVKTPADTQKPKPGGYEAGYPKAVGMNTIEVKWKRATDDQTAQADLRYVVRWKRPWVTIWETSHPEPFTNYPKDMTSYTCSVAPGTEYVVDVGVYDKYGNYQWYGERTVKTADLDVRHPTPGGYEAGYPKAVGTTSIELKWKRATDDQTGQAKLRYVVRWKKTSEITWQYSHSEPFTNYPQDMTSYTITGLEPNTKYEVNVEVFDEAGNGKSYGQQTVTIGTPDNTPPTSGGYQSGYPKATGSKTIELKWTRGSDNVTAPANLRYVVLWRKTSEITWQYSHSGDYANYPKDWTSYTITGLDPNTKYVVDVKVVDEAGNWNYYGQKAVKTQAGGAADTEAPTAPVITSLTSTQTTITATWAPSTDNVTPQNEIEYVVWYGISGFVFEYSPKGATSYTLSGLEPGKEYTVYIRAKDAAGNYTDGPEKKIKTKAPADTQKPTPGGYTSITSTAYTITLNWTRATDNVTPQNKLRYQVIYETKANYDAGEQLYGTTSKTDITTETITDLEPDTEYLVNVVVKDEAGNRSWYGERTVKTQAAGATIAVTGVTLSPASLNLEVGQTGGLTATVAPATATNKKVTWTSSNTAVATVDGSGTVKGIAPGTATITVTTADGGKTATAAVTVKEAAAPAVKVTSVTLNRNSVTINGDYEEIKLTATVAPATATDQSLTWSSDNPAVASVDATGLVTIHKKGKARITVTANDGSGRSDACDFNVIMTVANETIDGLRMWAHGGALHLTLPNAATVHIYNVNGAIVKTLFLPSGDHVQPLADGMYLVRVGERVRKILIK